MTECENCGATVQHEDGCVWTLVQEGPVAQLRAERDKCWEWQGQTDAEGYGVGYEYQNGVPGSRRVARMAYTYAVGEPTGLVLQTCENKLCCNTRHLADVTAKQAMRKRKSYPMWVTGYKGSGR